MNLLKCFSSVLLLAYAVVATGQAKHLCDSIVVENANGQQIKKSFFTHDGSGRELSVKNYLYNKKNDTWVGISYEQKEYDAVGNCIHSISSLWNVAVGDWQPTIEQRSSYDAQGRVLDFDSRRWNAQNSVWYGEQRSTTEYDAEGREISVCKYLWNEEKQTWKYSERTQYEYDAAGNLVNKIESNRENDEWVLYLKEDYIYDADNKNVVSILKSIGQDGQWYQYEKYDYTYTHADNLIVEEKTMKMVDCNGKWQNAERYTTYIDDKGSEVATRDETWRIDRWLINNQERSDVNYDVVGNKISDVHYRWIGYDANRKDVWEGVSSVTEKFDANGNRISNIRLAWDNNRGDWKGVVNEEVEYDLTGKVSKEYRRKWNSNESAWVNLSCNTYEYDQQGNKTGEKTSQWDTMTQEWKVFFQGKYVYTYNDQGDIKKIEEYKWEQERGRLVSTIVYY